MRNYNQNNYYQTSKEYYTNVLQNENKNLNLSNKNLDFLDFYLEKLLKTSYNYLCPIFNDQKTNTNYSNFNSNNIDKEFDQQVQSRMPVWAKPIIDFLITIYHFIFPKKIIHFIKKMNANYSSTNSRDSYIPKQKKADKFFTFKSPP